MQTQLPPRLERPDWPQQRLPPFSWWNGIVAIFLGAVALIVVGISSLNTWTRIGIVLGSSMLPLVGWTAWQYSRALWHRTYVGWRRMRQYDQLYEFAERATRDAEDLRAYIVSLVRVLMTVAQTFPVINLTRREGILLLVIGKQTRRGRRTMQLETGSLLLVLDALNWDILGRFTVVETVPNGYLVREANIDNRLWWGMLHEDASRHQQPRLNNAVAILLSSAAERGPHP